MKYFLSDWQKQNPWKYKHVHSKSCGLHKTDRTGQWRRIIGWEFQVPYPRRFVIPLRHVRTGPQSRGEMTLQEQKYKWTEEWAQEKKFTGFWKLPSQVLNYLWINRFQFLFFFILYFSNALGFKWKPAVIPLIQLQRFLTEARGSPDGSGDEFRLLGVSWNNVENLVWCAFYWKSVHIFCRTSKRPVKSLPALSPKIRISEVEFN